MIPKEDANKIKEQIIKQIDSWQASEEQKEQAKKQISEMPAEQLEDFLVKNKLIKDVSKIPNHFSSRNSKNFNTVFKILKKHSLEAVFVDVTTSQINKIGFKVVKVIIPQLQPLYLDEDFKYFGGRRLYSIPRVLGYTKAKTKEEDLNKIPHPFL